MSRTRTLVTMAVIVILVLVVSSACKKNGGVSADYLSIEGYGVVIDSQGKWVGDPTGLQGPQGPKGDTGADGIGIQGVVNNGDGTFTVNLTNGQKYTTDNLTGPKGEKGDTGAQGTQGEKGDTGAQGPAGRNASTFVVAASDSSDSSATDYTCDGKADNVEIQGAIDALPSTGGKVILLEGDYSIDAPLLIDKSGVTLEGISLAVKLKLADGANCDLLDIGDNSTVFSNILVRGLCLDGNRANQSVNELRGIRARLIENLVIEDCVIEEILGHGISLFGVSGGYDSYSSVEGCTVRDIGYDIDGKGIAVDDSRYINITGNVVTDTRGEGIWGGYITGTDYVNCIGNLVVNSQCGIMPSYNSRFWNIQGNQIKACRECGIFPNSAGYHTISGNQIECPAGTYGICVTYPSVTIVGNTIRGSQKYGVLVTAHDRDLHDVVISANTIVGDNTSNVIDGIRLETDVSGNTISDVTIQGNICKNTSGEGIGIYGDADAITNITLTDNRCYDDQTVKTQEYGIRMSGEVDYSIVVGNNCRGNKVGGLLLVGTNNQVSSNLE